MPEMQPKNTRIKGQQEEGNGWSLDLSTDENQFSEDFLLEHHKRALKFYALKTVSNVVLLPPRRDDF